MKLQPTKQYDTETLLTAILQDMQAEYRQGKQKVILAAMCKRLSVRMSTLQRHLTILDEAGLVISHYVDQSRWTATLTQAGQDLALT